MALFSKNSEPLEKNKGANRQKRIENNKIIMILINHQNLPIQLKYTY
jgi:hypothetical protein